MEEAWVMAPGPAVAMARAWAIAPGSEAVRAAGAAWAVEAGLGELGNRNNRERVSSLSRTQEGGRQMKSKILMGFLLILILFATPLFAQSRGSQVWRDIRPGDTPCWKNPEFGATAEQLSSLEALYRSYLEEIIKYRDQYLPLRYELRSLLSRPEPDARMVLERQDKLSTLQKTFDEISLQHFLKARKIFKAEQISRIPFDCRLGFRYGAEASWSRGWGQGKGWGRGR